MKKQRSRREKIRRKLRRAAEPYDDFHEAQVRARAAYRRQQVRDRLPNVVAPSTVRPRWDDLPQWVRDSWVCDVMEVQV